MNAAGTAAAELRSFVERVQRLEGEIAEINSDKRDVYAEAKSKGFDVPALKAVVAYLRKDRDKAEEQRSIFDLYLAQATEAPKETPHGTRNATRAGARSAPKESEAAPALEGAGRTGAASRTPPPLRRSGFPLAQSSGGTLAGELATAPGPLSETDAVAGRQDSIVEPAARALGLGRAAGSLIEAAPPGGLGAGVGDAAMADTRGNLENLEIPKALRRDANNRAPWMESVSE